jgi:cytochrome c biogenesis protein CcmG/thiol:disulfide interchange protein DsbE
MNRLLFFVPVVVAIGLGWLFYAGLNGRPPEVLPSPLIGKPAPDFTLPAMDAATPGFTRADLAAGHPTVVNFWASWCAPCRVEQPVLEALAAQKGVALYGVVYKDEADKSRGFLDELGNPFSRLIADANGRSAIDWGVTGVPETFVIDGQGIIRQHYSGALTEEDLQRILAASK